MRRSEESPSCFLASLNPKLPYKDPPKSTVQVLFVVFRFMEGTKTKSLIGGSVNQAELHK